MVSSGGTQMSEHIHRYAAAMHSFETRRERLSADLDARLEAEAERRVPQDVMGVERSEAVADVKHSLKRVMRL